MGIKNKDSAMRAIRSFVHNTVPSRIEAETKAIAAFALEKALDLSPYVTGRFMASWRISTTQEVEAAAPGKRSHEGARVEAHEMSDQTVRSLKLGQTWYLANGSPYAEYVEYGSPTSTPHYITRRVAQAIGGKYGRIKI